MSSRELLLSKIWEALPIGILVVKAPSDDWRDLTFVDGNTQGLEQSRLTRQDMGKTWRDLQWDTVAPKYGKLQHSVAANQIPFDAGEVEAVRVGTGARAVFWSRYVPIGDRMALILFDEVTERTVAREDQEETLRIVAHDLSGPARRIRSFTTLLDRDAWAAIEDLFRGEEPPPRIAKAKKWLSRISEQAIALGYALDSLTDYNEAAAMQESSDLIPLDVPIRNAIDFHSEEIEALCANVTVHDNMPRVAGDARRLEAVFRNLLGNALKYREPERAPKVEFQWTQQERSVTVLIADNGRGFSPDDSEKIFRAGTRLHPRETGTGMGLAIVRRIVQKHHGKIVAEGKPGRGSVFRLTFPRPQSDDPSRGG